MQEATQRLPLQGSLRAQRTMKRGAHVSTACRESTARRERTNCSGSHKTLRSINRYGIWRAPISAETSNESNQLLLPSAAHQEQRVNRDHERWASFQPFISKSEL